MPLSTHLEPRFDAPPGLFLSRDGAWFHDGQPVRHERLCALLSRSVARGEDGGLIVTTGRDRLPFAAEDAPLLVRTARADERSFRLVLSDESEEELSPGTRVLIDEEGRIRSPVKGGRFWALWARPAAQALFARVVDEDAPRVQVAGGEVALVEERTPRDWSAAP